MVADVTEEATEETAAVTTEEDVTAAEEAHTPAAETVDPLRSVEAPRSERTAVALAAAGCPVS